MVTGAVRSADRGLQVSITVESGNHLSERHNGCKMFGAFSLGLWRSWERA